MPLGIEISFSDDFSNEYAKRQKGKSLLEVLDNYIVIDIETTGLDPCFDEIIEVAAVKVQNGAITQQYSSLVKPEYEIDDFITGLTGITNTMVANAPPIEDILPVLLNFIQDSTIVGHNVNFDINFIYDKCFHQFDKHFNNSFIDTMRLSRRLFPEHATHKLVDLITRFNISDCTEHRALADAINTYKCYEHLKNHIKQNNVDLKSLYPKKFSAKDITANVIEFDETNSFYNKVVVFTGTLEKMPRREAMQIIADLGGICGDGVNKNTNYLILGNNDYCATIKDGKSSKHKKAESMKLKGKDIEIIPENVFYDMLFDEGAE